MKLSEVDDQETYVYIRYLAALAGRFNVGDYIRLADWTYSNDEDDSDEMRWRPEQCLLGRHRSRIDYANDVKAMYTPIYKVIKADGAYIEVAKVHPTTKEVDIHDTQDVVGYGLRDTIENLTCDLDSDVEVDDVIQSLLDNYLKLDDCFADSIVMGTEYTPYADSLDVQALLKTVEDAKEKERKELLRRRALKGHETRRIRKERAVKQAAAQARSAARIAKAKKLAKAAPKMTTKKKVKKKK